MPTLDDAMSAPLALEAQLAAAEDKIAHLELALVSSRRIGAAVGVIMATHRVDYDSAFAMILQVSQGTGAKLRDVAEHVIWAGALPDAAN